MQAFSKWMDICSWITLDTDIQINKHISFIKKQTGQLSKIHIYIRNKLELIYTCMRVCEREWVYACTCSHRDGKGANTMICIFKALYFIQMVVIEISVISESQWQIPMESPTVSSIVIYLSFCYSSSFDHLLVSFRSLLAHLQDLLQTGSCCKNIFWNSSINKYIKSMAVLLVYVGSLVQTPSWRIPQEVTTTRTICLIDALKSENFYGMKLPIQIGGKLWLT